LLYLQKNPLMKNFMFGVATCLCLAFTACDIPDNDKDIIALPQHPQMRYTNLENQQVALGESFSADLSGDFVNDFTCTVTLVEGSAENRQQFRFQAAYNTYIPRNSAGDMPVVEAGKPIHVETFEGYSWAINVSTTLFTGVFPSVGQPYWEGAWKDATNAYIPICLLRGGRSLYGWIKISADKENGTITFHDAAVSTVDNALVSAGIYF
jgi:hypothetical protein